MIRIFFIFSMLVCSLYVHAEQDEFSPWDAWRKGYSLYEDGEKNKAKNQQPEALKKYLESRDCYLAVKKAKPDWNQQIIDNRIKMCNREIDTLRKQIDQHAAAEQALPPPLQSSKTVSSSEIIIAGRNNLYELQIELDKYKKRFKENLEELEKLRQESERNRSSQLEIANLVKEKAVLGHRMDALQQKYDAMLEKQGAPEKEKQDLQNRLVEERMKLDIVNQRLKMQEAEQGKLKEEITELLRERKDLQLKQASSAEQVVSLARRIDDQNKLAEIRAKETENLRKELTELSEQNNLLNIKTKAGQDEINRLSKALENKATAPQQLAENRDLAKRLSIVAIENEQLRIESRELKKQESRSVTELKELRLALLSMTDQRDALTKVVKKLQEHNSKQETIDAARLQEMATMSARNQKLDAELKSYISKYEASQKRLETRLDSEYQNVLSLTNQVKDGLEKLKERDDELQKLQVRYSQSQDNNRRLSDTVQELKDKLTTRDDVATKFATTSADYRKLQDEQKRLQDELTKMEQINRENATIVAKYQVASKQLIQLAQNKTDLDILKIKHQQALELIAQLRKTSEITESKQVAMLTNELKNITDLQQKTEQKNSKYEKTIRENATLLADTKITLIESEAQREKLSTNLQQINAQVEELKKDKPQIEQLKKQFINLEKEKNTTLNLLTQAEDKIKQLTAQVRRYEDGKDSPERANDRIVATKDNTKEIRKLHNELAEERKTASELKVQIERLQKEQLAKVPELQKMQKILSQQQSIIAELEKESATLKAGSTTKERKIAVQNRAIEQYQQTISELEQQRQLVADLRRALTTKEAELTQIRTNGLSDDLLRRQLSAAAEIHRRQLSERDQRVNLLEQQLGAAENNQKQMQNDLTEMQKKVNLLESIRKSEIAAIENFNRSLSTDLARIPDSTPAKSPQEVAWHAAELLTVGDNAEKEQEIDVAMWNYRKILEFDPSNFQANARLGSICLNRGMYNDAAKYFHIAMKKEPQNAALALDYGLCLLEMKDYATARKLLSEAIQQHPNHDDLRAIHAVALNYCGDSATAITELREILKKSPNRHDVMIYLAEAIYDSGKNRDEAQKLYRDARKAGASPVAKLEKLGIASDNEQALQFLYNSAKESEQKADPTSAIWYYAQIRKLEGTQSKIANHLGLLQLQNNRPEEALENLRNRRDDFTSQVLCGIAGAMSGKHLDAAAHFRISQRMKRRSPKLNLDPAALELARKIETSMATQPETGQTVQAALEALRELLGN